MEKYSAIKESDISYEYGYDGYMMKYKGHNIGGAGRLTGGRTIRKNKKDLEYNRQMAEITKRDIIEGKIPPHMKGVMERIDKDAEKDEKTRQWEERWHKRSDKGVVGMEKIILGEVEISDQMIDNDGMWLSRDLWEREIKYRVDMIEQYLGNVERGVNVIGNIRTYLDDLEEILEKIPPDQISSAGEYLGEQLDVSPKTLEALSNRIKKAEIDDDNYIVIESPLGMREQGYSLYTPKYHSEYLLDGHTHGWYRNKSEAQSRADELNNAKKINKQADINESVHGEGNIDMKKPLKELNKIIKKRDKETMKMQKNDEKGRIETSMPPQDVQRDVCMTTVRNSSLIEMPFKKGDTVKILTGVHKNKMGIINEYRHGYGFGVTGACRVIIGKEAIWYQDKELEEMPSDAHFEVIPKSEFPAVEADIQAGFKLLIDEMEHSRNPYVVSDIGRKLYKQQQKENKEIVRDGIVSRI